MKIFLRLLQFIKPYHHFVPEYIIYSVISIIFGLINYTLLIPLLNILFKLGDIVVITKPKFAFSIDFISQFFQYYVQELTTNKGKMWALLFVCIIIFFSILISNIFRYLSTRVIARIKIKLIQNVRNVLFERIINQDLSYHYQNKKGNLVSVIMNDVQELDSGVGNSIQNILKAPLVIIFYLIVLFYISPQLTFFTLLFFPVSGFLISRTIKNLKRKGFFSQEFFSKLLSASEESLSGIKIVKAFNAQNQIINWFRNINKKFSAISKTNFNQREAASPLSELLGVTTILILVIYGGYLIFHHNNALTGSMFIAYLAIYSQMLPPLKDLAATASLLPKAAAAGERIFKILDAPVNIKNTTNEQMHKVDFINSIEFKDVKFKYQTDWVLKGINLKINKGETVALVGKSGSGKTTLSDLLFRFYDIQEGQILIDDIDIKNIKQEDLQKLIGIVTQEPFLFNDNVFNNITFGTEKINVDKEAEVKTVTKIAYADEFVSKLENGYYTNIGERGMKLSGGQRQRLTIARALYKNPPILIFDEATASLDSESELNVQKALDNAMQNRTCIIIAHRLSTIKNADKIVVLDKGKILEIGTHTELIKQNGAYADFIKMQDLK